jgi:hypothetical protein
MKIHWAGAELLHADGQDSDEGNRLFVQIFAAIGPKKGIDAKSLLT